MDLFNYRRGLLHCEDIPVDALARRHGTPLYVYSQNTILDHYRKIVEAFAPATAAAGVKPLICYSVKANSSLAILDLLRRAGSGFDVVSGGEIERVLAVGGDPKKIVFAGVGKTDDEIRLALRHRILQFNVESLEELETLSGLAAAAGRRADAALRINPDVDPDTHKYISTGKRETKFGVDLRTAIAIAERARRLPGVRLTGLHVHIGSQITSVTPYVETLRKVSAFWRECADRRIPLEVLDVGGGFGIWYKDKLARPVSEIAQAVLPLIAAMRPRLMLEPGRFIVGNAGILLTRVVYTKDSGHHRFVICDAGMNDLIRPSLYEAYHRIWPAATDPAVEGECPDAATWKGPLSEADVVGPICESGDFFAKDRMLPPLKRGDLVAVFSTGAYGFCMASQYNTHPRPAEVLVDQDRAAVIRRRERVKDLLAGERKITGDDFKSMGPAARAPRRPSRTARR